MRPGPSCHSKMSSAMWCSNAANTKNVGHISIGRLVVMLWKTGTLDSFAQPYDCHSTFPTVCLTLCQAQQGTDLMLPECLEPCTTKPHAATITL